MTVISTRTFLLLLLLLVDSLARGQTYTPTPLNTGHRTYVFAVNNSGMSTGTVSRYARIYAYVWSSTGTAQALGGLGGKDTYAVAINNSGRVAGYGALPGNAPYHAFLYTPGVGMKDLGTIGDGNSYARAINDSGKVVGDIQNTGFKHAFLWTKRKGLQDLGTLSGGTFSSATGINAAGHIVGYSNIGDGTQHAFLWTPEKGMKQLDLGPSDASLATAINNLDQVVGTYSSTNDSTPRAFLWDPATGLHDLGILPNCESHSAALALNDGGDVVGFAQCHPIKGPVAYSVIWRHSGALQKLKPLVSPRIGAMPRGAYGINASGQIVANGDGAWLLTPH